LLAIHSAGHFDLTIEAEGKELKASKFALMSCSKVFQSMFSCSNAIEAKTGIVKIEGISAKLIEAMIHWSYHIQIDKFDEISEDLYRVADKYQIVLLRKKCVKSMEDGLSNENLPPRLILAYMFNEEHLKRYVINYLREDYKKVKFLMASTEWIEFAFKEPELAKKIVEDIYA